MRIDPVEVANRFSYHKPAGEDTIERHALIRMHCNDLAGYLLKNCPESRELSLALTKLDEVCMYANAAVARHQ